MRLPLTILLGALIIGGVVGVVGIKMQPNYDESRLQPIIVDAPRSFAPTVPPVPPKPSLAAPTPQPAAPIAPPVDTNGVPAPPPALEHVQPTDDGGHHRGGDDRGGDDDGDDHGGGNDNGGHGGNSVPGDTSYVAPHRRLRDRLRPFAARTRIIGWVLLLVIAALGIVTFVTWRLLISATDARMHSELRFEIQQFTELAAPGVNPRTGAPFTGVDEVIREAIAYNVAKPNEKFVGYVDGQYRAQSRQQAPGPQASLARDAAFTRLVAPLTSPAEGRYHHPDIGEVLYVAVPVTLSGDPARGVITAAYLADAERTGADEAARLMLIVGAATMLGAVGAAWLVAGRILRPLRDITETARTITDTDLSGRIPWRGGDELGGLVATVNGMLDRVETGVAAQRRFIDDAGHELRTPITIIRGHLEVLNPADPADVESTVSLVDDELERMNRMVSDLLLLAQSEQPAFLRLQPVDVAALTRDVFDKVALLGDRDFELEATAEVQATLDPQRITQALVALADNACRYTEPGDRIAVGSMLDRGWLRFWIADSGRGVSDQDRSHIFERFSRGGAASQRSDGAGLGLAIVRAIAVAHGGDVLLDSIPGRGSTFTVVVPRMRAGEPWPES